MPSSVRNVLRLVSAALSVSALLSVAACGGAVDHSLGEDLEINEAPSALTGSDAPNADPERNGDEDRDCRDGDRHHHKHHLKHLFKILDGLDGAHDGAITIASLPPGLPDRLIERLKEIDANHDGVVTREEAKLAHRDDDRDGRHDRDEKKKHGKPGRGHDDRDHDDGDEEHDRDHDGH